MLLTAIYFYSWLMHKKFILWTSIAQSKKSLQSLNRINLEELNVMLLYSRPEILKAEVEVWINLSTIFSFQILASYLLLTFHFKVTFFQKIIYNCIDKFVTGNDIK